MVKSCWDLGREGVWKNGGALMTHHHCTITCVVCFCVFCQVHGRYVHVFTLASLCILLFRVKSSGGGFPLSRGSF